MIATEELEAEEALHALQALHHNALFKSHVAELLREGIVIQYGDGRIVYANSAAARLLRLTPEQLADRTSMSPEWESIHTDGRPFPGEDHPAMRVLATGQPQKDVTVGLRAGDGSLRWMSFDSTPWQIGDMTVAISVFSDVTAQFDRADELTGVMTELHKSALQREWPTNERTDFAARYRSVGPSRKIGGDFYGAYQLNDQRMAFFLGDVCGHGVKAAGLSSLARHTLHAIGPLLDDPNDVLGRLHDVVFEQSPESYLTAVYGYIDDRDGTRTVRFACGGHPQPILISGGTASYVGGFGSLIGMIPNLNRPVHEMVVRPGDQLVVYSDGLLSSPTPQLEEEELLELVPTDLGLEALVEQLLHIGSPDVADIGHDDTAVMAVQFN